MAELINLKNEVIAKYGVGSFEAGYIQYVFAKRPADYFKKVCADLLKNAEAMPRRSPKPT